MGLQEATQLVGQDIDLVWLDRHGDRKEAIVYVFQAKVHPYHGPYLVTDQGDVMLDRIESICEPYQDQKAA